MTIRDGIAEQHLGTWSRLTRLHVASRSLPQHTTAYEIDDHLEDAPVI